MDANCLNDAQHRAQAIVAHNAIWAILDKADRSAGQAEELLDLAHVARFHWRQVTDCDPLHICRCEYMLARVHVSLANYVQAIQHAEKCLDIVSTYGIDDFDAAYAHEVMARSLSAVGRVSEAEAHLERSSRMRLAQRGAPIVSDNLIVPMRSSSVAPQ